MGLFKKKEKVNYPIKLNIYRRYGNKLTPFFEWARYVRDRTDAEGLPIDEDYLEFESNKKQIPPIDIKHYYDLTTTREIDLVELDIDTFYPIKWKDGRMIAWKKEPIMVPVPVMTKNEKGEEVQKVNEDDIPLYQTDSNGNLLMAQGKDEYGKTLSQMVERTILDLNYAIGKNNELIDMPQAAVVSTYDKIKSLTLDIHKHLQTYPLKKGWKEWASIILGIVGFVAVTLFFFLFSKFTSDTFNRFTEAMTVVAISNQRILEEAILWRNMTVNATMGAAMSTPNNPMINPLQPGV